MFQVISKTCAVKHNVAMYNILFLFNAICGDLIQEKNCAKIVWI